MRKLSKKQIEANRALAEAGERLCRDNEAALKTVIPTDKWKAFERANYDHGCGGGHLGKRDILLRTLGMVDFVVYSIQAGLDPDSFELD